MIRTIAITLKIPDNAAYTALTALQKLGFDVARVERSEIYVMKDNGDDVDFLERVAHNETIFNLNKHRITDLGIDQPRPGEVWISENDARPGWMNSRRYVGWRLVTQSGAPVEPSVIKSAAERLLCNPAVETAHFEERQ
jgi:phosphoribosylformylglycinamidine (FGAM) synthase PurS component